jgi:uridine kinase
MTTSSATSLIKKNISVWLSERQKLVIAIDGYSGAGKTTILKSLAAQMSVIKPVHMDDFVSSANTNDVVRCDSKGKPTGLFLKWRPKSGLPRFRNAIADFKSSRSKYRILVVEGVFLQHPEVLGNTRDVVDHFIYVDVNHKTADSRRAKRERARWGAAYVPESHPASYARHFKVAHKQYMRMYDPKNRADLAVRLD